MSEPKLLLTVVVIPLFCKIEANVSTRFFVLSLKSFTDTSLAGIRMTRQSIPFNQAANSLAHSSVSFTPLIIAYSNEIRLDVRFV